MAMRHQPQGRLRLAGASGLAASLVASVVPSQNLAAGLARPVVPSSGVSRVATPHGIAFQHSAADGGVDFGAAGGLDTLAPVGTAFSVFMRVYVSVLGVRQSLIGDHDAAGTNSSFGIEITATNQWRLVIVTGSTQRTTTAAAGFLATVGWHDVFVAYQPGVGHQFYVDGALIGALAYTPSLRLGSALRLGSFGAFTTVGFQGRTAVCHIFRGDVSAQHQSLRDNPWQVFDDGIESDEETFAAMAIGAPPADTSITGAAAARIAASGSLSTSIRLPGSASVRSTASGALTTAVRLSGTAAMRVSAAGLLASAIPLVGGAQVRSFASGVLAGEGAALVGAATLQAAASAALSTSISLTGAAGLHASASGALAGGAAALGGTAALRTSAVGALSTEIALVGVASAQVVASGLLTDSAAPAALSGQATMRASATGSLSVAILLSGAARCEIGASGRLAGIRFDMSKISPARIVVFEGSGSRLVPFESSGSRVTPFDGSGSRVVVFEGSGSRIVRFQ